MSEGSEYQDHAMPNQPPGMTLRTRTNVKTQSKPGVLTRDCTFEVAYSPDLEKVGLQVALFFAEQGRDAPSIEEFNTKAMELIGQRIREANNFLARESFRIANIREDKELQAVGLPRRWEDDGLTPAQGSTARMDGV